MWLLMLRLWMARHLVLVDSTGQPAPSYLPALNTPKPTEEALGQRKMTVSWEADVTQKIIFTLVAYNSKAERFLYPLGDETPPGDTQPQEALPSKHTDIKETL